MRLDGRHAQTPSPKPFRARRTDWSACKGVVRKRGALRVWLDNDMSLPAPNEGRPRRSPVFSHAAIQFCLSIKGLSKLPLGQTAGRVAWLFRQAELDWPVPDCTTLSGRQKAPASNTTVIRGTSCVARGNPRTHPECLIQT